ncbi:hypothetical protein TrVE_jg8161 [Triparma verrucosa]|uniref:Uncharacterized protein n=1 Tax=Triparma verrucosa TaxID=1606542 RepID=A0A9W7BUF2_9STRA|nr:hypothetical protein TrVE_jg8161 [Triparma verrucosa]
MDKDNKTKAAVKQLRARLMAQVKKLKGLKDRRQALLDENRELTIAIAKKRGETLHVKKPTGFRASGTAPSYSYASRKQRTSVHMDKIKAKKAEEDKAKAKQKAREQRAFGGGGVKAAASGPGSPLAAASPAKKRFTLNRTSSSGSKSGAGTFPTASSLMAAASPAKKRLTLNRTSSGAGGGGLLTEKKKIGGRYFPPGLKGGVKEGEEEEDGDRKMPHNPDLIPPPMDAPAAAIPPPAPKRPSLVKIPSVRGEEEEVMKLMQTTETKLINLTGFNMSKMKLEEIARLHLSGGLMSKEEFQNFKKTSVQEDSNAKDIDELFVEAEGVLPVFKQTMRNIVEAVSLSPDDLVTVDGTALHSGETVLTFAPLKGAKRAKQKMKDDYEGKHLCLLDLVRCSIIVETEEQIAGVLQKLLDIGILVRLKNRFATPLPTGMRDCLLNVKVDGHVAEVQVHQANVFEEKHTMHIYYEFFREMFPNGADSYEELMRQWGKGF